MSEPSADSGANAGASSLFKGKQFWLSHNVPQRARFKEMIEKHGGIIRLQEKDADIKLVDHTRKNLPQDTYSYRYVETSVRKGKLENLEPYRAGPSNPRPVGATNIPARGSRFPYTLQEDQDLWDYMEPYEKVANAPISGNKFYQDFAKEHTRHTYQSYRDRYLKRLRGHPRPGGPRSSAPPPKPPPAVESVTQRQPTTSPVRKEKTRQPSPPRSGTNELKRKQTADSDSPSHHKTESPKQKRRAVERTPTKSPASTISRSSSPEDSPSRQLNQLNVPLFLDAKRPASRDEATSTKDTNQGEPTVSQPLAKEAGDPVDSFLLELPFLPSPEPESETEEQDPKQDVDAWIDDRLGTGKAETVEQIVEALRCTSMDPNLADKVLEYLVAGKGIPDNVAGVWTPEDDKSMEAKDTRVVDRVLNKHGMQYFDVRWRYLNMARAKGLEQDAVE